MTRVLEITSEMITMFAPGCAINNPIAYALKEVHFPAAREIVVHSDMIIIDSREQLIPSVEMTRWINSWNRSESVTPTKLRYRY
jgi:hypothetical protein